MFLLGMAEEQFDEAPEPVEEQSLLGADHSQHKRKNFLRETLPSLDLEDSCWNDLATLVNYSYGRRNTNTDYGK